MLLLIHAVVIRRLNIILIGHDKRHYNINEKSRESGGEKRKKYKKYSNNRHIDVEILGKTCADATDFLFARLFIKFLS